MPTANLKASIRVSKGILQSLWEDARAKDFTFFGMCIKTNQEYRVDDLITLSLSLELDMGLISVEHIHARVARVHKLVGFYEYGLEFDKKVVAKPDQPYRHEPAAYRERAAEAGRPISPTGHPENRLRHFAALGSTLQG